MAAITDEFSADIEAAAGSMAEIGMTGAELRMVSGKKSPTQVLWVVERGQAFAARRRDTMRLHSHLRFSWLESPAKN